MKKFVIILMLLVIMFAQLGNIRYYGKQPQKELLNISNSVLEIPLDLQTVYSVRPFGGNQRVNIDSRNYRLYRHVGSISNGNSFSIAVTFLDILDAWGRPLVIETLVSVATALPSQRVSRYSHRASVMFLENARVNVRQELVQYFENIHHTNTRVTKQIFMQGVGVPLMRNLDNNLNARSWTRYHFLIGINFVKAVGQDANIGFEDCDTGVDNEGLLHDMHNIFNNFLGVDSPFSLFIGLIILVGILLIPLIASLLKAFGGK